MAANTDRTEVTYTLYTAHGKLKHSFRSADLSDMRNVCFPALQRVDVGSLDEITVIQAGSINI